jgi:tetratricopeptide (TPR) repeat protein
MRTNVGFGMALLLTIVLSAEARVAMASEAQRAVDEANAALAAQPLRRDAARSALERATAAADDQAAVSEAYFRLGALDEEEEAFAQAVTEYRQSIAAKPVSSGARWARNAANRIQWLSVRAEGNFAPLVRLQRFKRDPALAADSAAIDALARDTEAFPPGLVRAESRMLVATAWLGPLHRPRDAVDLFRLVATDPTADGVNLRFAERGLVDALIANGEIDAAMKEAQVHAAQLAPEVVTRLQRLQRRRTLLRVAQVEVAVFVGFAVVARVYLDWRRRRRDRRAASRSTWIMVRVARALWVAATVIAAAFVLLGALAPTWLERIGL